MAARKGTWVLVFLRGRDGALSLCLTPCVSCSFRGQLGGTRDPRWSCELWKCLPLPVPAQWGSAGEGGPWETRVPWLSREPPLDMFLCSFSRLFPQTSHTSQPLRFPTCCASFSAISAWVAPASAWIIQLRVTLRAVTFKLYLYSCLKNPMDRGVWQATVLGATKSQTTKSIHVHPHTHTCMYTCVIEVQLIDNVVVVSGVRYNDPLYIHTFRFFFRFFSFIDYYKILSIVPCAIQKRFKLYIFKLWGEWG